MESWRDDQEHIVYRCYDAQDHLLYVGCTYDVYQRMSVHRITPRSQQWLPLLTRIERTAYPTRPAALAAERHAIETERPQFNIHHRQVAA
jgi:excinuclease UvrABC nuclease subunit